MPDLPNVVFLDFEASSLSKHGFPIEVAWVFATGEEESHLIRPDPSWTDWDDEAEAIHGISRKRLREEGRLLKDVAERMVSTLAGHALYATAPSWDGKWLSKLLRTAGFPRHALRLEDTEAAHVLAVQRALHAAGIPEERHPNIMQDILAQARHRDDERGPAIHRALADARRERCLWIDIQGRAKEIAAQFTSIATGGNREGM
jgi:hypothetical protein